MFQITAKQLIQMNEQAHREKQNRVLNIEDKYSNSDTMPLKVDMTKNCICQPIILHTNHAGVQSWRCLVVFGVEGQTQPEHSLLDVPLKYRRQILKSPVTDEGTIGKPQKEITLMGGATYEVPDNLSDDSATGEA